MLKVLLPPEIGTWCFSKEHLDEMRRASEQALVQTSPTRENNPVGVHSLVCIYTTSPPPVWGRLFHTAQREELMGRASSLPTPGHHVRWQRTRQRRREGFQLHSTDNCTAVLAAVPRYCSAH